MDSCARCGRDDRPLRADGDCFGCHVRGIGFTFEGGAFKGRAGWNVTQREFLTEHVPADGSAVRADA